MRQMPLASSRSSEDSYALLQLRIMLSCGVAAQLLAASVFQLLAVYLFNISHVYCDVMLLLRLLACSS
jgi:hypothetical protein